MKVGNDCGLNKQTLFKDLTGLWLNTASISKPSRRGRLSEHGMELCNHRGETIGIQRGSLSPAVTQLETTELDPRAGILLLGLLSTASRHMVAPPPPLLPSFPPGPPGPPTVQYQVVLRSPENQCECKVMPSSATTLPCLHLNL